MRGASDGRVPYMDLWPLLTDDLLTGVYSTERQLRPRTTAVAVRTGSIEDFREVVNTLCTRWGGGFSPLVSVNPDAAELDDRVVKMLLGSNIDGLEGRKLLPEETEQRYSDQFADAAQWLLRQVAYLKDQRQVQTCRGVPTDSPWYPAYLALFGDLPDEQPGAKQAERPPERPGVWRSGCCQISRRRTLDTRFDIQNAGSATHFDG